MAIDNTSASLPSQINLKEVVSSMMSLQKTSSSVISIVSNVVKDANKISKNMIRRANDTISFAYKGLSKLFEQTHLLTMELAKYRRVSNDIGDINSLSKEVVDISKQITSVANKITKMFASMSVDDGSKAIVNIVALRSNINSIDKEVRLLMRQLKEFSVDPNTLKDIQEWNTLVKRMSMEFEGEQPKFKLGQVIIAINELTSTIIKPIQDSKGAKLGLKDIMLYKLRMTLLLDSINDLFVYTYNIFSRADIDMNVVRERLVGDGDKKPVIGAIIELMSLPGKIFSSENKVGLLRTVLIKHQVHSAMKSLMGMIDYIYDRIGESSERAKEISDSTAIVKSSIEDVSSIIDALGGMSKSVFRLIPLALLPARLLLKSIFRILIGNKRSKGLISYIITLQEQLLHIKDLRKTRVDILRINNVIKSISLCELSLVAAGVLAIPAMTALGVLMVVSMGVFKMISLLGSKTLRRLLRRGEHSLKDISVCILLLSSSVTLLVLTGMLITMGIDEIGITFMMLGAIVSTFTVIALASKWIRAGEKVLVAMGLCITLLSLSVLLLVETGELIQSNGDSLLRVSGLLAVTVGAALILGMMKSKIAQGVLSMLAIGLGVVLLSVAVTILAATSLIVSSNWDSIAKVGLLLLGVVGLAFVLGKMVSSIAVGVSSLILLSTSIIIMSVGVGLLVGAAKLAESVKWESFGKIGAILGVAVGVIIGLGVPPVAALVGLGSVVLLGLSASIAVLCGALNYMIYTAKRIEKTSIDTKKVKASVRGLFDVFVGKGGVLEQLKSFKLFPWHVARMVKLSMIASRIGRIARIVTNIANLRMVDEVDERGNPTKTHNMTSADFTNAALNGVAVTQIFAALMGDKPTTIKLASGSVVVNPIDEKTMKRITLKSTIKFRMLSRIVKSIGNMASTVADVASLKIPIEWNKEGKPVAFRKLDDSDFKSASTRITELMTFFVRATADSATVLENVKKRNLKKIQVALSAITPVTGMVDSIKTLAEGTIPIYKKDKSGNIIVDKDGNPSIASYTTLVDWLPRASTKIKSNITSIVDTMLSAVASIMTDDRKSQLKQLKKFNKNYGESLQGMIDIINSISATDTQATAFNRNVNSSLNLLTKVSTIDINKLKYAKDLFAQIAAVAKQVNGNFDKLADVINEKLIKTLEDLSKAMDGINTPTPQRAVTNALPSNNKAKDPTIKGGKNSGTSAEMSIAIQKSLEDIKNQLHLLSSVITTKGAQRALRIIE